MLSTLAELRGRLLQITGEVSSVVVLYMSCVDTARAVCVCI